MTLNRPTKMAAKPATRALFLAASGRMAPIRFAMRVEAAMEMGKGILFGGLVLVFFVYLRGGCRVFGN